MILGDMAYGNHATQGPEASKKQFGADFDEVAAEFGSNTPGAETGAYGAIANMRARGDMYADPTSAIYTGARNMFTKSAQENSVLQAMQYLRNLNKSGITGGSYSGVQNQNIQEMFGTNFENAMKNMTGIYQQGQATADSIYANTMNADVQIANALAGLKFDTQKLHYDRTMDFITGAMSLIQPFKIG